MAVERDNYNQEELNSLAHLLRTFLPDHDDLSLNDTALLGQTEAGKQEASALNRASEVETVYEASNQSHRKAVAPIPQPPVQTLDPDPAQVPKQKPPDIVEDTPWDKVKDPDFEPNSNSEEEEEDADSDATVEIPLSELREACPSLVPKVARERAARKSAAGDPHIDNRMKWYACFICDDQYGDVFSYSAHMTQHLEEAATINCHICGVNFTSQSLFTSHRKLSTFELLVDRVALKKAMDSGVDIKKNEGKRGRKALREESYICNVCGKGFWKYPQFLNHVNSHEGVFSFQCAVCQEGFKEPCLLRSHIDLQHPHVLPFQCRRCLKRFKLRGSLATHLKTCDVDPSCLPYAQEMQFIDQLSQKRKLEGEDQDAEAAQYSCPICMVMYDSPEDLQRHMKHHDETKPYKCDVCGRGFRTKYMMQKHASVHQEEVSCRCEICGVELLTRSGYNAHLRGHRNQEIIQAKILAEQTSKDEASASDQSAAPTEDKALKILQSFQKDNMTVKKKAERDANRPKPEIDAGPKTRPKNFACPMCGMLFHSSGEKFQTHCRREHKDAEFIKCDVCKKLYYGQTNLEKHRKLHKLFTDTFPCDECDKVFRRKFALQVHKKMHSFKKFVKCDICGQEFRFVSEVDKHKNKKHRYDRLMNIYKCNICGQRFPVLSHLSVHCYCHNEPDSTPFECDLCGSAFKTSIELKQHIFKKHEYLMKTLGDTAFCAGVITEDSSVDGVKIKTEPMDEEDSKLTEARASTSTLPSSAQLLQSNGARSKDSSAEVKREPGVDGGEPDSVTEVAFYNIKTLQYSHKSKILKRYNCEICNKAFSSNSDLKTHRRTHSGETPFKCDYCERSFKQRGHRKLHIQVVHTKEMPYKCDECDAAFPTRYRYQIHMKRHTGVRDYKCVICDKEFYTLGKLNDHMKRRHPEDWHNAKLSEAKEKEVASLSTPVAT